MLTIAVSLITVIISLPSAGMIFLIACGATIFIKTVYLDSPSAIPASVCPLSTDKIPPLITSAVYAAEFNPNAKIAMIMLGNPLTANITKNIINNCKAIGVPRITVVYTVHINFGTTIHLDGFATSTSAMMAPNAIPIKIAKYDICIVSKNPCSRESIYSGVLNNSAILLKKSLIAKPHIF